MMSGYLFFLALILYGLIAIASTHSYTLDGGLVREAISTTEPTATYKYDRIDEVKKKCESVLSSAAEFRLDSGKIRDIKEELSFMNGDWGQEAGDYPLLPFEETNIDNYAASKLVSFWVADVERDNQSPKSANVNGILVLSISQYDTFFDKTFATRPYFHIWPGQSELSIFFQGIYTESQSNGGKKVMCLLGNTVLPYRDPHSADPWQGMKKSGQNQSSVSEDDQILLVLWYPLTFTLTNREIQGQMKSLNPKSNPKFFDEVTISSQLTKLENYEFSSQNIVSKACDPYPYEDKSIGNVSTYKGLKFCETLEEITRYQAFSVLPNWRCNDTYDDCRKMGPYDSTETTETNGEFKDAKLSMQNVKCEQVALPGSEISAKVSAVFRAISSSENPYSAEKRSGFSNMSLAAEGIWNSSSGQLCMVGCLGHVNEERNVCNSRICMYISTYFSIKHRNIIFGTISSMEKGQSFFPLSFEKSVQPSLLWHYFRTSHPSYKYTKSNAAVLLLKKDQGLSYGNVIKKSLLKFPRLEDAWSFEDSLSMLSEDLTLHVSAAPDPKPDPNMIFTDVNLEIISVGSLFGRHWSNKNSSFGEETTDHVKAEFTEKQLLLNVSAQLSLTGRDFKNFSLLFLEGLYDPCDGKMYLVGCRDIRATGKILFKGMDVEDGLDCSIEVVISYPPTTARFLVSQTASISISSQRTENSPLHFGAVKFKTFPIMYRKQREDILSRRGVEVMLRILTLSLAITCISSQIFYMRKNTGSVSFISLVMLGVQASGYILPLVTGAESLFERAASDSYKMSSYDLDRRLWYRLINYLVKLLVMISLLLTLRLCQKVWKSRIRLLAHSPLEPYRSPSDKLVLMATFITHLVGFVLVTFVRGRLFQVWSYSDSQRFDQTMQVWEREIEEYAGLVQDFFLFPQVIGNLLWQIDGKPLRKFYYIGITLVRLLPHFYNYLRAPSENPYFANEYEFVNTRFDYFSKFGDIAIPMTAVFLALLVYIQQKWNYSKLSRALTLGRFKLLPMASRGYERLPSIQAESELSSGVHGRSATSHGNHTELD